MGVKTKGGISSTTHKVASPAELESAVERLIQEIARQSAEVHLLEYEPFKAGIQ